MNKSALRKSGPNHGKSGTRLHRIWKQMRHRCNCTTARDYRFWGARGVSVCEEWSDFDAFSGWATANGYRDDLTIERVDCAGNYCPDNCIWIPNQDQGRNKRNSLFNPDGELWSVVAAKNGIKRSMFYDRRYNGWDIERAATQPPGPKSI